MFDQMDVELATHLAKVRGLGLADELTAAIEKLQKPGAGPDLLPPGLSMPATLPTALPTAATQGAGAARHSHAVAPAAGRGIAPKVAAPRAVDGPDAPVVDSVGEPDATALAMPGGKVTSQFGWRHDPFTGQAKFHRGVDLRAVYGQDVNAAGSGTVVFSGEQRGYGNTVVVEHANGTRSRYAHLSATLVSKGDRVDSSTPVGRAGHSGRATGTHLHFEITTADGRAVPPEQWTTRPALMASAMHQVVGTAE
jgi:murein DD-endopeptidase MepM/ murein hydrolase activator NlpD